MSNIMKWMNKVHIPVAYLEDEHLNPVEFKALVVLQSLNFNGETIELGKREFCQRVGVSPNTLSKAINNLMEMGYIKVFGSIDNETGARLCNHYQITVPGDEE
jgi:hypothetical protein